MQDDDPGIPDIELAMNEGFSQARGLGMGLPWARQLLDAFEIWSEVSLGTWLSVEKWAL